MSNAMRKYGVCSAQIDANGYVRKGESLRMLGEGTDDEETIKRIICLVEERGFDFPVVIYSYFSKYLPSKTGRDSVRDNPGAIRFKPKKPCRKTYDWFIDESKRAHRIGENLKLF
jgi:hypothetical protein